MASPAVAIGDHGRRARDRDVAERRRAVIGYRPTTGSGVSSCPNRWTSLEVLPRTPSGKLLKRTLREPYWQGVGRRIG